MRIPPDYRAVELRAIVPLLSRRPPKWLFRQRRLEWSLDNRSLALMPMLCAPTTATDPRRNQGCQFVDSHLIDQDLKRFDGQRSIVDFDMQIGLPDKYDTDTP